MGIKIHITIPHNVTDLSLAGVAGKFHTLDDIFSEISRYYAKFEFEDLSRSWASRDTSFYQGLYPGSYSYLPVVFDAPAGFSFDFGPHVLSIHHHTRLGLFCTEPEVRQLLRVFTWRVLRLLSGERAIYSPNDYGIYDLIFDGRTFGEIEAHLSRLAPPAASFAELENSSAEPRYYVDRFEELYVETTRAA
jgi:hypothetical protein